MSFKVLYCGLAGVLMVLVMTAGLVSTAHAGVIAEWNFDDTNNMLIDSVGGNDLAIVLGSSNVYHVPGEGGVGMAAEFDAGTGRLVTSAPIDLSSYRSVRLSWSMQVKGDAVGIIFDHGWTGPSSEGWYADVNEGDAGTGYAGLTVKNASWTLSTYEHEYGWNNTIWADYAVEVDLDATDPNDQIKIFKDGVNVGANTLSQALPASLPNEVFYFGAFQAGGLPFVGVLDNIKLESISAPVLVGGDANGDGSVDVSDLGILATNYGTIGGMVWADGDFTDDGNVDVSDLGILATNYGSTPSSAVPEPSTLSLLIFGALAIVWRRRKAG